MSKFTYKNLCLLSPTKTLIESVYPFCQSTDLSLRNTVPTIKSVYSNDVQNRCLGGPSSEQLNHHLLDLIIPNGHATTADQVKTPAASSPLSTPVSRAMSATWIRLNCHTVVYNVVHKSVPSIG